MYGFIGFLHLQFNGWIFACCIVYPNPLMSTYVTDNSIIIQNTGKNITKHSKMRHHQTYTYTSNLYWWGKGWPVDGLPFPDTGCPVPDVSIYYMSNINELPDGILFHWFCKCTPPWMFLPLDIPSEYRPEHVTFGLLCVIFKFPSRIFCRRVPGFATDCPCGVWCRGLTTCLLYVGPPLEF